MVKSPIRVIGDFTFAGHRPGHTSHSSTRSPERARRTTDARARGEWSAGLAGGAEEAEALEQQRLTVPVPGISSSHGSIPDMAASIRPWAGHATGIGVPDAGHFIPDEQPDAVAAALTDFMWSHTFR